MEPDGQVHEVLSPGATSTPKVSCPWYRCAAGERAAIAEYRKQAGWIQDPCIVENLNRVILDEERHVAIFQQMEEQLCLIQPS